MSVSIQDCASDLAAERRQRRKERVLGNSENRLNSLLHGADLSSSTTAEKPTTDDSVDLQLPKLNVSNVPSVDPLDETMEIEYLEPTYMDIVGARRVEICIGLGVLFLGLHLFGILNYIVPLWLSLALGYQGFAYVQSANKFPKHGYMVNFLLAGGINEKLVRYSGFVVDALWSLSIDSALMAFGYLTANILSYALLMLL